MKYCQHICILILFFTVNKVKAQDPIFSQYLLIPESLNPAFTGTLQGGYTGIIHRSQWPNENKRIDTDFAFINAPIGNENEMGIGLSILNQREVFTSYNFTQVNAAFTYSVNLNEEWRVRLGMEAGFGIKNYNFSNLLLEDQINTDNGSISGNTSDPNLLRNNDYVRFFDISTGILFYDNDSWFGVSLKHLNNPNISFTDYANVPLEMFWSAHLGHSISLDDYRFSMFPDQTNIILTANYMRQSQYNRVDIGTALNIKPFTIGLTAATNLNSKTNNNQYLSSINLFSSIQVKRFVLGYSYDINTSGLSNTQGIHEISLTWELFPNCYRCDNYSIRHSMGRE